MISQENPICILDSGVGGAIVLSEIMSITENENFFYLSDSKNHPYGEKSETEIQQICSENIAYLLKKRPKCIVLACNTASTEAADFLRKKYPNVKIFAIEPAYKLAGESRTLVMATPGTIRSKKFQALFKKYYNDRTVLLPCPGLAEIIENGESAEIHSYLKNLLSPYRNKIEKVVLGCTHYSMIKPDIEKVLGDVEFLDGAPYLAKNIVNYLTENNLRSTAALPKLSFKDTSDDPAVVIQKSQRFYNLFKK